MTLAIVNVRRLPRALAAVLIASSFVAACGDDDDGSAGGDTSGAIAADTTAVVGADTTAGAETTAGAVTTASGEAPAGGGTFVYGYEQELDSYNNNHADTNAKKNSLILNQILPDVFNFEPSGELVLDEELMVSAELTSQDPQVVTYVVRPEAAWSDGDPIDCDDFQLSWLTQNGVYKQTNEDGSVTTDDSGNEVALFPAAATTGYEQIESVECSEDGKTITTTYSAPFADWKGLFSGGAILPAHIIEAETGVADVGAAIDAADEAAFAQMAEFWATGWVLNPGELKPELTPSGDAYVWESWDPGAQITLARNPNFWGTPGKSESIVVRFIAQDAQAQALANGEIQAMDPQPVPELKAQLENTSGIQVWSGEQYSFEHFDFNFAQPDMQRREVREAFAKCLPRQLIVDNLIKPQNPQAIVLNSRLTYSFEPRYTDTSGGLFDEVDIPGARALLESVDKVGIPLRINSNANPRRINEIALVKDSCDQAGFVVEDISDPTFFDATGGLALGDFDVALFAWTGSPLVTSSSSTYVTGGGNNNGKYSNAEVDTLLAELNQTLDEDTQLELLNEIDSILWADLVSIPAFTFPAIEAHVDAAQGVEFNPTQQALTWNAQAWVLTE